jgi:ribonuclease BN (tRNA processing enzyme)
VDVLYHESTFYNQRVLAKDDAFNSKEAATIALKAKVKY